MDAKQAPKQSTRIFWIAAAALAAALANGQEIRGVVREAGTEHPLPDVEVTVREQVRISGQPAYSNDLGKVRTDTQGRFRFEPGKFGMFSVSVAKQGYSGTASSTFHPDTQVSFPLREAQPARELEFHLSRPAEITGRVVGPDDRPLANFTVAVLPVYYQNGRRFVEPAWGRVDTDATGRFTARDLRPGRYVVITAPQMVDKAAFVSEFTEEDVRTPAPAYRWEIFRGGAIEPENALPLLTQSGQSLDVGTIRVRRVEAAPVRVKFLPANCKPGQTIAIAVRALYGTQGGAGRQMPCGQDFLLRGLAPGVYRMNANDRAPVATRAKGSVTFEVTGKPMDVAFALARGVPLDVMVRPADGAGHLPLDKIAIEFQSSDGLTLGDEMGGPGLDVRGRLRKENLHLGRYQILGLNPPAPFYVSGILFNGSPLAGRRFTWTGSGSLEVVIDDHAAAVGGRVTERSEALAQAQVLLAREPFDTPGSPAEVKRATADDEGRYSFAALAPGIYRVAAVAPEDRDRVMETTAWQALWQGAAKVELDRGAARDVDVEARPVAP